MFSLSELRLYLPLDVQRKCSEWIKLGLPVISRIVLAKTPRDPRDVVPLTLFMDDFDRELYLY